MATRYWRGGAPAVKQVDTVEITLFHASTTYTITIGGQSISVAGDTDETTTAANLAAALNASAHPYFSTITWTDDTGTITATADSAGMPHTFTASVTGGSGTIGSVTSVTANSGPCVFSVAGNWDAQTLPSSSDTIIYADSAWSCLWDVDQSALTGMTIYIDHSYTGKIGHDRANFTTTANGSTTTAYPEYRGTNLVIDWSQLTIGRVVKTSAAGGSPRLNLRNPRASSSSTHIERTVSTNSSSPLVPAVQLDLASSSATVRVIDAVAGVGIGTEEPGSTVTMDSCRVTGSNPGTWVRVAPGVTIDDFRSKGFCYLESAANMTLVTCDGGELTIAGSGYDITTVQQNAGTVRYVGNVDVTTWNLDGGVLDPRESNHARTITTLNVGDAVYHRDPGLTITNENLPSSSQVTVAKLR